MSKRVIEHPQPASTDAVASWRSLGQREGAPSSREALDREFPAGSGELSEEERGISRREFGRLMGASTALAGLGLAACRRAESLLVPYKNGPEWIIPGKPVFYASALPRTGGAVPVVVTTHEGRPTLIAPNREHPEGSTDAFAQASILDLYNPNRSRQIRAGGQVAKEEDLDAVIAEIHGELDRTAFVVGWEVCPTRERLLAQLAQKGATLVRYEPMVGLERQKVYDEELQPGASVTVDFEKADRILSIDCDFLGVDRCGDTKAFSARRQGGNENYEGQMKAERMNRLYQVESAFSLTGGMADHRLRARPSQFIKVLGDVARELGVTTPLKASAEDQKALFAGADDAADLYQKWVKGCARDLSEGGQGVVLVGERLPEVAHRLAAQVNLALGSYGEALKAWNQGLEKALSLPELVKKTQSGELDNLVLLTPANPVYDAPGFGEVLSKFQRTLHWGLRADATAWACQWHVPAAHPLESWSDVRSAVGRYSVVQPLLEPLFGAVEELDFLGRFLAQPPAPAAEGEEEKKEEVAARPTPLEMVRETFGSVAGSSSEEAWVETLRNGFLADSSFASAGFPQLGEVKVGKVEEVSGLEVIFTPDASVWDGRFIDNAWLQEAPDPINKLCWDNAAFVSPQTAKDLGIYDKLVELESPTASVPEIGEGAKARAPMVELEVNGKKAILPLMVSFGQADGVVILPVGYGQGADDGRQSAAAYDAQRPAVSEVGLNTGFNVYPLRAPGRMNLAAGAKMVDTDAVYPVARTQEHFAMYGRALAREISTQPVEGKGDFDKQLHNVAKQGVDSHVPPNLNLYEPKGSKVWHGEEQAEKHLWDDLHQWGMTIDLNTCTGCNSCLIACQAENNIPVVGKEQVAKGREMHWIRMDRYFAAPQHEMSHGHADPNRATPEWVQQNPESIPQPVACVQCEQAPCETVCPVNATVHTPEGLNAMAYNRCIGTRYCANNCPYKARRFNYFDYNKRNPLIAKNLYRGPFGKKQENTTQKLQRNPNVSVRMRGVMEKCTYCVQRLESAKIAQKQRQKTKIQESGQPSVAYKVDRVKDLRLPTDLVRVACQDACESEAISFGNLLDGKSRVARAKVDERNYDLLNYINTRPRTSYLARVKNPNPAMPDARYLGQATIHIH